MYYVQAVGEARKTRQLASEQQRASSSWGPFLADSLISVSWYSNPLIKYKVTLEMLTSKVTPRPLIWGFPRRSNDCQTGIFTNWMPTSFPGTYKLDDIVVSSSKVPGNEVGIQLVKILVWQSLEARPQGETPYKGTWVLVRNLGKKPVRGTKILFHGRGLTFFSLA